jgi:hypothetical protein
MEETVVAEQYRAEFESEGVKRLRRKIAEGEYEGEKRTQAVRWLRQQELQGRTFKFIKKQLALTRRTARDTRITLLLAVLIFLLSILQWLRPVLHALR